MAHCSRLISASCRQGTSSTVCLCSFMFCWCCCVWKQGNPDAPAGLSIGLRLADGLSTLFYCCIFCFYCLDGVHNLDLLRQPTGRPALSTHDAVSPDGQMPDCDGTHTPP